MSINEAKNRGKTGQVYRCLPRDNEAMIKMIYSVMTREEFIAILDEEGYSYNIEGDKIVVTHNGRVYLKSLTSLPPGVEFKNGEDVSLDSITSLHHGVVFKNRGDVDLSSITGNWFKYWKGNIEGIESNRLLNVMIKQGIFER